MSLAPADFAVIGLFFLAVLAAGFSTRRTNRTSEGGYLLAGRTLTLPVFIMTLVATWYGGVLGIGEFTYLHGLSNWVTQGLPFYLFAAVFAFTLAPRIRESGFSTIPDRLETAYGRSSAVIGSLLTLLLITPAPYFLMLGVIWTLITGWPLVASMLLMAGLSVSYLAAGGFEADIRTDIVEFFFMFAGFGIIVPWCVAEFGGPEFLGASLPPLHLTWHGGSSAQYIFGWFVIALWTFVDPGFHQRCYAAADGRTARKGILLSICLWFLFDALTLTAGLYARAVLPDLASPTMAFPMLADRVLPPVALGFFYAGMFATIMSTVNTTTFISGQTLGHDLILRLRPGVPPERRTRYTRLGVVVCAAAAVPIAWAMQSVIDIWYTAGTIALPGLLAGVLSAWSRNRMTPGFAVAAMSGGSGTAALWWLGRILWPDAPEWLGGVEPVYPGLGVAFGFWGVSLLRGRSGPARNNAGDARDAGPARTPAGGR